MNLSLIMILDIFKVEFGESPVKELQEYNRISGQEKEKDLSTESSCALVTVQIRSKDPGIIEKTG